MSDFLPKKYVKKEPPDPFFARKNYKFTVMSGGLHVLIPIVILLILTTQIALPLLSIKTQNTVSEPVRNTALGYVAGFQSFEFEELDNNVEINSSQSENVNISPVIDIEIDEHRGSVLGDIAPNNENQIYEDDTKYFLLSIPKLDIEDALVEIDAKTLDPVEALGHYKGSALPGEIGNSFIYGHSVLPVFYNPKNYKTIFSTLGKLEPGDKIFVKIERRELVYEVERTKELKPEEVQPLAEIKPRYLNASTMVLMTCSPPGTKLRRMMVETVLVE